MSSFELSVLFFLQLTIILLVCRIVGWAARWIGQPQVVGEMIAGVSKSVTIKIKNITDQPIRITKAIPGCGCTTPVWPKDPIAPGASGDVEITMRPGEISSKTLRFG